MYELYQDANLGPTIDLHFESSFTMRIAAKKDKLWTWSSKQLGTEVSCLFLHFGCSCYKIMIFMTLAGSYTFRAMGICAVGVSQCC